LPYGPWPLLAHPAPLPETLVAAAPEAIVESALGEWGSDPSTFPAAVPKEYVDGLRSPLPPSTPSVRSTAPLPPSIAQAARIIECPVLALWSMGGPLDEWYADVGGPLGMLRQWGSN